MYSNIKFYGNHHNYEESNLVVLDDQDDMLNFLYNPESVPVLLDKLDKMDKLDNSPFNYHYVVMVGSIKFEVVDSTNSTYRTITYHPDSRPPPVYHNGETVALYVIHDDSTIEYVVDDYPKYIRELILEQIEYHEEQIEYNKKL